MTESRGAFAGLSDARLTGLVALALFALAAWPLLLVELPPLQDLPNHVATAHIVAHLDLYPEYVFNGLFKSNALLTLWFYVLGGHGLFGAARAFTAVVLAANALALPLFVLHFAGRSRLLVATLFVWPLVHSFSVTMGFLNFAFAFALALILLTVLDRQRARPTLGRGAGIAALSGVLWYAHPFPLAVVGVLVALHAATRATWKERFAAGVALLVPLAPAGLLSAVAAQHHLIKAEHTTAAAAVFAYLNPWEIAGHLWTDVSGALTRWGSMTIVPALLLPVFAWRAATGRAPLPVDAGDGGARRRLRRLADDAEQLELPQLPVGSVPVGGAGVAAPGPAAPAGRDRARGLRAVVLRRDGRRLREAGPRPGRVHGGDRRRARARHAAAVAVRARQDQRLHGQPDPRLGLLHGRRRTRRRRWCSRWSAPTRSRTGSFRRAR